MPNGSYDQLMWIWAVSKAENGQPEELIERCLTREISAEVGYLLADFLDRHRLKYKEGGRPKDTPHNRVAMHGRERLSAELRSSNADLRRLGGLVLAGLLKDFRVQKVRGRPKIPAYLWTEEDVRLRLAAEQVFVLQHTRVVPRNVAVTEAAKEHNFTVQKLKSYLLDRSSKRLR